MTVTVVNEMLYELQDCMLQLPNEETELGVIYLFTEASGKLLLPV